MRCMHVRGNGNVAQPSRPHGIVLANHASFVPKHLAMLSLGSSLLRINALMLHRSADLICSFGRLVVDEKSIGAVPREQTVESGQVLVHAHERLSNRPNNYEKVNILKTPKLGTCERYAHKNPKDTLSPANTAVVTDEPNGTVGALDLETCRLLGYVNQL